MLMALAPPAASVPPTSVATISHSGGRPALGHDHRGEGGDQEELDDARLGQGDIAPPTGLPRPARLAGPGDERVPRRDMRASAYAPGPPGDQRPGAGTLGPACRPAAPSPSPPTVSPPPGTVASLVFVALIVRHRRRGPAHRLGPGLPRLARVLGRPPHARPSIPPAGSSSGTAWSRCSSRSSGRVTLVASFLRTPPRRDLGWLCAGLVAGVLAQAVIGGIVVYTKLNPYLVMVHFLASMLLVADAVVLVHRSTRDYGPGSGRPARGRARDPPLHGAARPAGRGARRGHRHHGRRASRRRELGPAGGQAASRSPCGTWRSCTRRLALLLVGVTIALVVTLHAVDVPERVRRGAGSCSSSWWPRPRWATRQYFTHLPALLVELHLAGVTVLVIGTVQTFLSVHAPPRRGPHRPGRRLRPGGGTGGAPSAPQHAGAPVGAT